jgi:MinD-like ATPase involved in chromosome partitioning or flagellar assembly
VDAYKVIRYANVIGSWTRGIVVNRTGKKAEVPTAEIEHFMSRTLGSMPVLADIPEDSKVHEAELEGVPVVVYDPDCPASVAINELAKLVAGEANLPHIARGKQALTETTQRLVRALTGRTS